jgi:hypothetical protein
VGRDSDPAHVAMARELVGARTLHDLPQPRHEPVVPPVGATIGVAVDRARMPRRRAWAAGSAAGCGTSIVAWSPAAAPSSAVSRRRRAERGLIMTRRRQGEPVVPSPAFSAAVRSP